MATVAGVRSRLVRVVAGATLASALTFAGALTLPGGGAGAGGTMLTGLATPASSATRAGLVSVAPQTVSFGPAAARSTGAVRLAPIRKALEHPMGPPAPTAAPRPALPPMAVQRTPVAAKLPGGTLEQLSFPDPADRSRVQRVLVWRPPGPDSAQLPVVYWLHGVPGQPEDFLGSGYLAAVAADVLAGRLAPVVIAMPDGNSPRHADTEWADSASGDQDLATLVATKVITAVEQGHPRPAALRTLAGFSMGAYGAADIALHHPDVFGSLVLLEGYFHVDDPSDVLGHNTATLAAHTPTGELAALGARPVFLADYANDTEPVVAGDTGRLAGLLAARKATYRLVFLPGADHSLAPLPNLWPEIERFLQTSAWHR